MEAADRLKYIQDIDAFPENEVHVIQTGKEIIDIPAHRHQKNQLILTRSGTLHVSAAGREYFIPEGHICIIPSELTHILSTKNKEIDLLIIYYSPGTDSCSFGIYNTNSFVLQNLDFVAKVSSAIKEVEDTILYQFVISFLWMLPRIAGSLSIPIKGMIWPEDQRLVSVLKYIAAHFSEDLKLADLAEEFDITERSLSRLFRKAGLSFTNFLNYQRVIRAIELFSDGGYSIREISFEVGFNTPNNFNRVFRRMTGMNPTAFLSVGTGRINLKDE